MESCTYVDGVHLYHPPHRHQYVRVCVHAPVIPVTANGSEAILLRKSDDLSWKSFVPGGQKLIILFLSHFRREIFVDVVFVHGLLGGPSRTWRQADEARPHKVTKQENGRRYQLLSLLTARAYLLWQWYKFQNIKRLKKICECGFHFVSSSARNSSGNVDRDEEKVSSRRGAEDQRNNNGTDSPSHNTPSQHSTDYTFCWPKVSWMFQEKVLFTKLLKLAWNSQKAEH